MGHIDPVLVRDSHAERVHCKRLNFRGLKFSRIGPKLKIICGF
ncbi:MAG: hypothetical protein PV344_05195 [Anaplasma sp.]|nr:hypothetical protein [Anaplasma sp.]